MYLTYLDSNSWLIEFGEHKILVDPWLIGQLIFGNLNWLFKASRLQHQPIPEKIDLILLSQGLEDHAHTPTLKQLNHDIPVVASPNAAKVVQQLGYTQVTALAHGETFIFNNNIEIKATPGTSIGPTLVENGYLVKELASGFSLYYEPHGNHSPSLKESAPVDVVITPLTDLALPLVGPIIKGRKNALELAKWLQPQFMLSTAEGKNIIYEGVLTTFLSTQGSIEEFSASLKNNNLTTQVLDPKPGERLELQLEKRTVAI